MSFGEELYQPLLSQPKAWKPSKRLHLQDLRALARVGGFFFCNRGQRGLGMPEVFWF